MAPPGTELMIAFGGKGIAGSLPSGGSLSGNAIVARVARLRRRTVESGGYHKRIVRLTPLDADARSVANSMAWSGV
jgi:hypothetical protein